MNAGLLDKLDALERELGPGSAAAATLRELRAELARLADENIQYRRLGDEIAEQQAEVATLKQDLAMMMKVMDDLLANK
jgi:hypothetical protein